MPHIYKYIRITYYNIHSQALNDIPVVRMVYRIEIINGFDVITCMHDIMFHTNMIASQYAHYKTSPHFFLVIFTLNVFCVATRHLQSIYLSIYTSEENEQKKHYNFPFRTRPSTQQEFVS